MATNFATETLKAIIAKNAAPAASDASGFNSTVAEFKAQDSTTETTRQPDTQHSADPAQGGDSAPQTGSRTEDQTDNTAASHGAKAFPTLSDSALTELKAAYAQVEAALADVGKTEPGKAAGDQTSAAKDTTSQEAGAHTDAQTGKDSHPASLNPLAKFLADVTGETSAEVRDVLQQVHAVLRQEHAQQAGQPGDRAGAHGNHDDASVSPDQPSDSQPTGKAALWHDRQDQQADTTTDGAGNSADSGAASDAKGGSGSTTPTASAGDAGATGPGTDDTTLWHDRLIQQNGTSADAGTNTHGGNAEKGGADNSADNTGADGSNAMWHHLIAQDGQQPTLDADVVAAVDHFTEVLQDLNLTPMPGHTADQAHLDTAA